MRLGKIIWLACVVLLAGCTTLGAYDGLATREQLIAKAVTYQVVEPRPAVPNAGAPVEVPPSLLRGPVRPGETGGRILSTNKPRQSSTIFDNILSAPDAAFVFAEPLYPQELRSGQSDIWPPGLDFWGWAMMMAAIVVAFIAIVYILDGLANTYRFVTRKWRRWRTGRALQRSR